MRVHFILAIAGASLLIGCGGGGGNGGGDAPPSTPNGIPVAVAGTDFAGSLDATGMDLDGTGSSDPDGDPLTFAWSIVTQPSGDPASISTPTGSRASLVTAAPGQYVIELVVRDNRGASSSDRVTFELTNEPPNLVLDATPTQLAVGRPAGLNASGSNDPNNQPLSYSWTVTAAPPASNIKRQFFGPAPDIEFDAPGVFQLQLAVTDGFETATQSVAFTVTQYQTVALEDAFEQLVFSAGGVIALPRAATPLGMVARRTPSSIAVSSEGQEVRIINADGSTAQSFTVPEPIVALDVSPDGAWISAAHTDKITVIDVAAASIIGTWATNVEPYSQFVANDGFVHLFPATGQLVYAASVNGRTGQITDNGPFLRHKMVVRPHPDGERAYGASTDLFPADIYRFDFTDGELTSVTDTRYHGDHLFCHNLWIDAGGEQLLTACGILLSATEAPGTDMAFAGALDLRGQVIDAARNQESGHWFVIEALNGAREINVYSSEDGRWLRRLDLPQITPGLATHPLQITASQSADSVLIVASDHATDPEAFSIFTLFTTANEVTDLPPVAVVANSMAGFVQSRIRIDAAGSYDPEGQPLSFQWSLTGQPSGSDLSLTNLTQSHLEFTPSVAGFYTFDLVVDDGTRTAEADTVSVRVVEQGGVLQARLEGDVFDIAYNKATHELLYTSSEETNLRALDLEGFREQLIALPRSGRTIGVSPSGGHTVVSHSGLVSLLSVTQTATVVVDTQSVDLDWGSIVVDDRAIAFLVQNRGDLVAFPAIDFSSDRIVQSVTAFSGQLLKLSPDRPVIYAATAPGSSPSDIERYDMTNIESPRYANSPYHGDYEIGHEIWINEDGTQLLSQAGNAFSASTDPNSDMVFLNPLSPRRTVTSADHSQEAGLWVVASGGEVYLINDETLVQTAHVSLEPLFIDAGTSGLTIDRVFFSDDGDQIIVVAHSDNVSQDNYVVQILALE
jgi:chitinase